ncbi:OsmC family protein [Sporosarcina sp. FSL W7-1349]|uniref:OsmC family protein n=1 Tax=Sporosarcina sp. FSL W7-1349 TaxID=2921561 RepID=UPI0030F647C1
MSIIRRINGEYGIHNDNGMQVKGMEAANGNGLSPIELLESSLGLCIAITMQRMFERDGVAVAEHEFSVAVSATKAVEGPSRIEQCVVKVRLPDHFTPEYKKKLMVSAERACTIGNTLKQGITIRTEESI